MDQNEINFFEQFCDEVPLKRSEYFKKELSSILPRLEIAFQSLVTHSKQSIRKLKFYTKSMDEIILENLFVHKSFDDLAEEFGMSANSLLNHIENVFYYPRCFNHLMFKQNCAECLKSLDAWRENGLKKINAENYQTQAYSEEDLKSLNSMKKKDKKEEVQLKNEEIRHKGYFIRSIILILEMCEEFDFPVEITIRTLKIFAESVRKSLLKRNNIETLVGALIYVSARINSNLTSLNDVANYLNENKRSIYKTYSEIKKIVLPKLKIKIKPRDEVSYIKKHIIDLQLSEYVKNKAIDTLKNAMFKGLKIQGKNPSGTAIGAIYIAARILGLKCNNPI